MKTTISTLCVSLLAVGMLSGCCNNSLGSCADEATAADASTEAAATKTPVVDSGAPVRRQLRPFGMLAEVTLPRLTRTRER